MNKSVFLGSMLALGGILAAASPALALEVTYTTTGVFSSSGTNVFTGAGGTSATYVSYSGTDVPSLPGGPAIDATVDQLGTINVAVPSGDTLTGTGNFVLTINQTIVGGPTGSSTVSAALTGQLTNIPGQKTGDLIFTFASPTITIDGVTYTLEDLGQNGLLPTQLAIGKGGGEIEAAITSAAPEPTFFALTGLGFFGLAAIAARRYRSSTGSNIV
jgi:hypothetical protein